MSCNEIDDRNIIIDSRSVACPCEVDFSLEPITDIPGYGIGGDDPCPEVGVKFGGLKNCDCAVTSVNFSARKINFDGDPLHTFIELDNIADIDDNPIQTNTNSTIYQTYDQSGSIITSNDILSINGYSFVIMGSTEFNVEIEVCIDIITEGCESDCNRITLCERIITACA